MVASGKLCEFQKAGFYSTPAQNVSILAGVDASRRCVASIRCPVSGSVESSTPAINRAMVHRHPRRQGGAWKVLRVLGFRAQSMVLAHREP